MADNTVSRLGQANSAGDVNALFLKVFSGEVLATFNADTVMADKTRVRNITSGKSASFPAMGRTVAEYHTPGAEIAGNAIEHGEKVVTIDDLLIAHASIANIDEAKNHYEVRSEYSTQIGQALAQTFDRNLLSLAIKTARAGEAGATASQGAAVSTNIGLAPTIATLVEAIYAEAAAMDDLFLPANDRFVIVSPTTYWGMVQNEKLINRDFNGSNGDYAKGLIMEVAGMKIVKSSNLAVNHVTGTVDFGTKYQVDASDTSALIFQRNALATVKLMELGSESEYTARRQSTLMVSKMAVGHGAINPQGIRELRAAA